MWMARVYYVDTAIPADKKKRRKNKTHVVFDGSRVFRVKKLTELEDASEIYIDAMFQQIYGELIELIERNVKIFSLKNLRLLKRLREENGVEKSDEVDARLLSIIPKNHFKQLTLKKLSILKLIGEYERYVEWKKTIQQWIQICPLDFFKESVKRLQRLIQQYARKIIREVKNDENYATTYRLACDMLGVRNSVEVAILVARLPLNWKLSRLYGLLGLTPHKNKNYHHKLRAHLSSVATAIYLNSKRYKQCKASAELIKDIEGLSPNTAIYMLQLRILKVLKKAWQQSQCMLVGGQ